MTAQVHGLRNIICIHVVPCSVHMEVCIAENGLSLCTFQFAVYRHNHIRGRSDSGISTSKNTILKAQPHAMHGGPD